MQLPGLDEGPSAPGRVRAERATEFERFFRGVHGHVPFPWQSRFAAQALGGEWPTLCDLPPASGKTACIDIWVFVLAMTADRIPRPTPMRLVFVVDRRLVVDDAHARARHVAGRLAWALRRHAAGLPLASPDPTLHGQPAAEDEAVLREAAVRLADLAGPSEAPDRVPLQVAVLRGGLPRDNSWVESPHQPTAVVSTVDQVGSRLLFRGYGASEGMWPVHAGLLGEDCLVVLDEAHLSTPFAQTLDGARKLRERAETGLSLPWRSVTLTATPSVRDEAGSAFGIDMDRRGPDRAPAPALDRRFAAQKMTRFVRAPSATSPDAQARAFAKLAEEEKRAGARVVGIVVNRVRLARRIHEVLSERHGAVGDDPAAGGSLLLTGRCRPLERDALLGLDQPASGVPLSRIIDRIRTGRPRAAQAGHATLFVVSTQAIEAGADVDFDALVTEIAPWSSLRQRFGRLDRAGELVRSRAAIVCTFSVPKGGKEPPPDHVYGSSSWRTRRWLWELAGGSPDGDKAPPGMLDMGVDGQAAFSPAPDGVEPERTCAPFLSPAILDLFAQTSPRPHPDPDPALWLHGPASGPPDLQVVWRRDTPRMDVEEHAGERWAAYAEVLAASPPTAAEALSLPVWTARRWLSGLSADVDLADLETQPVRETADNDQGGAEVFVWRGVSESGLVRLADLRPGDVAGLFNASGSAGLSLICNRCGLKRGG